MLLDDLATQWVIANRDRTSSNDFRVTFKHNSTSWKITYQLEQHLAKIDCGQLRVLELTRTQNTSTEYESWQCSCPLQGVASCLHKVLVVRGLNEPVEERAVQKEDVPDPNYQCDMLISPLLAQAALQSGASLDVSETCIRVLDAEVRKVDTLLVCDCPMASANTCLHRVLVDAWARGLRPASMQNKQAHVSKNILIQSDHVNRTLSTASSRANERLPQEDVERFEPVLVRCDALLAELITFGFQRAASSTLERLDALRIVVRSMGVREQAPREAGLGRLVRALDRVRQVLGEFQERLVTTNELDVLRALAVVRNIIRALRANTGVLPMRDFAGATQQEYEQVGVLDVQGLGFEAWVTTTGFAGVTTYLADLRTGRVLTRTNTLPADAAKQFNEQGWGPSWAQSLASQAAFTGNSTNYLELARSRFLLSGAQIASDSGRVSGSSKTQLAKRDLLMLGDPKVRSYVLDGPADAIRIAKRLSFDLLGRPPVSPPIALIAVQAMSSSFFDRATQTLSFVIRTQHQFDVPCLIQYREDRILYIDNLEKLCRTKQPPTHILVRLSMNDGGLNAEPITAYFQELKKPQHLTFAPLEAELVFNPIFSPTTSQG